MESPLNQSLNSQESRQIFSKIHVISMEFIEQSVESQYLKIRTLESQHDKNSKYYPLALFHFPPSIAPCLLKKSGSIV
jgi:hypothetical protein